MRIAIVSDAWHPQINGVVTTLEHVAGELRALGHEVLVVNPENFFTLPCPSYPEIRLAPLPWPGVRRILDRFAPEAVHIATEGPLGHAARGWCLRRRMPFTTSFHTQFPEYLRLRAPVPLDWSYAYLRRFHGAARRTLVPTASQRDRLLARGFGNLVVWCRGVDTELFVPGGRGLLHLPRPIALYVGRVAVEKNIEAFLSLALEGSKVVVGDGPDLPALRARHPEVHFLGFKRGRDLARHMAAADVFVFPSRTDTYGLVMLEAMACGLPVAAYPVTGPVDVVQPGRTGVLDEDLGAAVRGALQLRSEDCVAFARANSWRCCAERFFDNLAPPAEPGSVPA